MPAELMLSTDHGAVTVLWAVRERLVELMQHLHGQEFEHPYGGSGFVDGVHIAMTGDYLTLLGRDGEYFAIPDHEIAPLIGRIRALESDD